MTNWASVVNRLLDGILLTSGFRRWNFAIVQLTPPMLTAIDAYTFLVFGVLNVCFIPFM